MKAPISQLFEPHLASLRFAKRGPSIFTSEITPNILGWIGLNTASRHTAPGHVAVNPIVGVRYQDVEQLIAECRPPAKNTHLTATASEPLGYLLPERKFRHWMVASDSNETVRAITEAIREHGLPFMNRFQTYDDIISWLSLQGASNPEFAYRKPAALFLAGKAEAAKEEITAFLAALGPRVDLAAQHYRQFSGAFRARMAAT